MSKSAPSKVQGPQLALVVCGSVDKTAMTKLNLNCPLGIFLSYSLQTLRVELDKKIKEVNEQSDLVVFEIPPNTPDDRIEAETTAAKETALAEKERLNGLAVKLNEIAAKMTAASVHRIELLDESNGLVQCQDNIKLNAGDVLKPYGKYTIGIIQDHGEGEPLSVLPLMIGAAPVGQSKKGK